MLPALCRAAAGPSADPGTIDSGTTAFYVFGLSAVAFVVSVIYVVRQYRWLSYAVFALLFLVQLAFLDRTISTLFSLPQRFDHYAPLLHGSVATAFGYWLIARNLEGLQALRIRRLMIGLALASLLILPLSPFVAIFHLYVALNVMMLSMFALQILPPLTWSSLPAAHKRWSVAVAVLVAGAGVGFYLAYIGGAEWAEPRVLIANRMIYLLFVGNIVAIALFQVFALERARESALLMAVESAEHEARTSRALFEAEVEYSRTRQIAELRSQQLAAASHDIKQPLAALRASFDILTRNHPAASPEKIQEALAYLEHLAATYVDAAATDPEPAEADEALTAAPEAMDVQVLLETLTRMFAGDAARVGAGIRIVSTELVALVRPLPLIRILSNLVANALQHGNCRRVLLGCRRRGNASISVEVHDDGAGMSAEELVRVQARGAKGQNSSGNGLGLAILRDLADREGFRLQMTSSTGRGTCVRVLVPLFDHPRGTE